MSMYTKRFQLYARAQGTTPEKMGAGYMFVLWIQARTQQWKGLVGRKPFDHMSEADHVAFDEWLETWVGGLPVEAETEQSELGL